MAGAPSGTGSSSCHSLGWRMNGRVWRPSEAAMRSDQLLECRDLAHARVVLAEQQQVGRVGIASSRLRLMTVCAPKTWSGPRLRCGPRPGSGRRFGPKTTAPRSRRRTSSIPRPGARPASRPGRGGAPRAPRAVRRWSWPVNQTRPRLPEPTTAIADSSAGGGMSSGSRSTTPSVVWLGQRRPCDGRPDALAPRDLGQERVHERGPLARRLRLDQGGPSAHQAAHDFAEALAVALLERRAEALAVIGEDRRTCTGGAHPRLPWRACRSWRRRRRAPGAIRPAPGRSGGRARRSR